MIDNKAKRKNNPNRRRKVLLMIVLPMVALIASFMALSPQIEAWLATDPFTPQCHFETDRVFVAGYFAKLGSLNSGISEVSYLEETGTIPFKLSPDGNYLIHNTVDGINLLSRIEITELVNLTEIKSPIADTQWSPNSRYVAFSQYHPSYPYRILDVSSSEIVYEFQLIGSGLIWSPDSRYILYLSEEGWQSLDTTTWEIINLPPIDSFKVPEWASDSKSYYYKYENSQYEYHLNTYQSSKILELPVDDVIWSIDSFDRKYAVLYDQTSRYILYDYQNSESIQLEVGSKFLMWLPNHNSFMYSISDNFEEANHLYRFDADSQVSTDLNIIYYARISADISPSRQYIPYLADIKNSTYMLHNVKNNSSQLLGVFSEGLHIQWINHENKELLILQKRIPNFGSEWEIPYIAYIIDPETLNKCKLGITGYYLKFQPQG